MTNQEAAEALRKVSLAGGEVTITPRDDCVEVCIRFGEHFTLTQITPERWPAEHAETLLELCEDVFTQAVTSHVRRQIRAARGTK